MAVNGAPRELGGPWFGAHPAAAVTVSTVLFAVVFGLGVAVAGHQDAVTVQFVLPIALIAFAFGSRGGLVAGGVALGLTAAWVWIGGVDRTALEWVSAAVPLLLIGALVGHASDRLAAAHKVQLRLERAELQQREAADVNDTILQHIAVAKWMFEADRSERGLEVLTETVDTALALVSDLLAESDALRVPHPSSPVGCQKSISTPDSVPSSMRIASRPLTWHWKWGAVRSVRASSIFRRP